MQLLQTHSQEWQEPTDVTVLAQAPFVQHWKGQVIAWQAPLQSWISSHAYLQNQTAVFA